MRFRYGIYSAVFLYKVRSLFDLSSSAYHLGYMHFSPANDFSWLDLEAVGDYVSGDQISGGLLGLDAFQNASDMYQSGEPRSQSWQPSAWMGDMSSSLLF